MGKKRKTKRGYKLIAFKAYHDTDGDILDWWESIEEGDRSDEIRDLIRERLGIQPKYRKAPVVELPELVEVRRDTLWIKEALNDMPAYLERIIQQVAANAMPAISGGARASPLKVVDTRPALTEAETQRRARRMRRATW